MLNNCMASLCQSVLVAIVEASKVNPHQALVVACLEVLDLDNPEVDSK